MTKSDRRIELYTQTDKNEQQNYALQTKLET